METEIHMPFQRALLLPLRARNQAEQEALPERVARLSEAARQDNHMVVAPTHIVDLGGEMIGYLSINGLPTVRAWFDSRHKNVLRSKRMIEDGELIVREQGHPAYIIGVSPQSPFLPHMAGLGFERLGDQVVFIKKL